jgi:2-iminobutanoate/2-iminopropanoate deaminase
MKQVKRQSIDIPGLKHRSPIPMASRVGRALHSSGIPGLDPSTGEMPEDPAVQARNAFEHMKTLLAASGATLDHVVRVTVFISDETCRALINPLWVEYFPDETSRPARHILVYEHLRGGMRVQLEFVAECDDDT